MESDCINEILIFIVFNFFIFVQAISCPLQIANLKTNFLQSSNLCEIFDKYKELIKWGKYKFNDPEKIANIIGPRLINYPDWIKKRNFSLDTVRNIYEPAPLTWNQWMVAADKIDAQAKNSFKKNQKDPISMEWLIELHKVSLQNLIPNAGHLRNT